MKLGVLFGGPSPEHQISLLSGHTVVLAARTAGWDVLPVGVDVNGVWYAYEEDPFLVAPDDPAEVALARGGVVVAPVRTPAGPCLLPLADRGRTLAVDVFFPVLHGPYGEDGTVQGLLAAAGFPFVGAGVGASAVCMDKDFTKRILRDAGLPVNDWLVLRRRECEAVDPARLAEEAGGLPLFVKPARMGSSVGVSRVTRRDDLPRALAHAAEYDDKILLEPAVEGRELECAVLDGRPPAASGVAEIVPPPGAFYSYEEKYLKDSTRLVVDPRLPPDLLAAVRRLSLEAFRALDIRGLARVDFFLTQTGDLLINEVNTLPGFTAISMYPKLWERAGLPLPALVDRLVRLSLGPQKTDAQANAAPIGA